MVFNSLCRTTVLSTGLQLVEPIPFDPGFPISTSVAMISRCSLSVKASNNPKNQLLQPVLCCNAPKILVLKPLLRPQNSVLFNATKTEELHHKPPPFRRGRGLRILADCVMCIHGGAFSPRFSGNHEFSPFMAHNLELSCPQKSMTSV